MKMPCAVCGSYDWTWLDMRGQVLTGCSACIAAKAVPLTLAEARVLLLMLWDERDGGSVPGTAVYEAREVAMAVLAKLEAVFPEIDYGAEVDRNNERLKE